MERIVEFAKLHNYTNDDLLEKPIKAKTVEELYKLPWERDFFLQQNFDEVVELVNVRNFFHHT